MNEPSMNASTLAERVKDYSWYHTIDLGDGVVTPGMFDHRHAVDRYLIPDDLSGMSCLDIGTMDGFWAFEMERRGAAHVVAVDIEDPEALDWPASLRHKIVKTLDATKGERFALVHARLRSNVQRHLRSVYDVGPDLGEFDLVYCGDLLVHIKDPITAVERMRSVCRGNAIVVTPTIKIRGRNGKRALAEFDGIDEFQWWAFTLRALERLVLAAGFARIAASTEFELPASGGGTWKGLRGVVRAEV